MRNHYEIRGDVVAISVNLHNRRGAAAQSKTGLRGVWPHKDKFGAKVQVNGRPHYLGLYSTAEEAARVAADFRAQRGIS